MFIKDVDVKDYLCNNLLVESHANYLANCAPNEGSFEEIMSEYLKMSGMYWCITAYHLINQHIEANRKAELIDFISKCQHSSGGISASIGHDPHILYTLSAIQILITFDCLHDNVIDLEAVTKYIKSLQQEDGSFAGDEWGEIDIRFSFCAIASLALLNKLDEINIDQACSFIVECCNSLDAGFGSKPGSESHAGLIYCALGSLSLIGRLDLVDCDLLGWWLCERQQPSGGLNGRPEKFPDLCYSWWVLASLQMIGRLSWIDRDKLLTFILSCQNKTTGGFSDRSGHGVDLFHTLFGNAGISFLVHTDNQANSFH